MSYLVDTNILLRVAEPTSPSFGIATDALEALLAAGELVYIVPQNLYEFWVVATRPVDRNGLGWTAAEALAELQQLMTGFHFRSDNPSVFDEWLRLVSAYQIVGSRAHDLRLIAAMRAHRIDQLLTLNVDDFRPLIGAKAVHPSAIAVTKRSVM